MQPISSAPPPTAISGHAYDSTTSLIREGFAATVRASRSISPNPSCDDSDVNSTICNPDARRYRCAYLGLDTPTSHPRHYHGMPLRLTDPQTTMQYHGSQPLTEKSVNTIKLLHSIDRSISQTTYDRDIVSTKLGLRSNYCQHNFSSRVLD